MKNVMKVTLLSSFLAFLCCFSLKSTETKQLFANPVAILLFKDCYIMAQIRDLIILYHRNVCDDVDEFYLRELDNRIMQYVTSFHLQLERAEKNDDDTYFRWGELDTMGAALGYVYPNHFCVGKDDSFAFTKPVDKNESKKYTSSE